MSTCTHLDQIRDVTPQANGCVDCLAAGDAWMHALPLEGSSVP